MCINNLRNILHYSILQDLDKTQPNNYRAILKEEGHLPPYKISIYGIKGETLLFKLDKSNKKGFVQKSNYLSSIPNLHRSCDYILVVNDGGCRNLVFVEMKSSDKARGAFSQLFFSQPFVAYLRSLLLIHYNQDLDQFNKHFIFVKKPLINKQSTLISSDKYRIENFNNISIKIFTNKHIHFHQIIE